MGKYNLRYGEAAKFRYDGLPLGSGDFGARVNSYETYEDISLNLDTLWSGEEKNKMNPLFSPDKLEEIREHILKEEYKEAEEISKRYVLGDWTECYLPAGNLIIKYLDEAEAKTSFYRELSLDSELFKGYKNISFEVDGSLHKYMIGANEDYYEILRLKEELKQEFPEAFIVAFKNGQRMNTGEAVKEFVKNKRKAM